MASAGEVWATLLSIVCSFHEGMKASVKIKGDISDSFVVCNDVR